MDRVKTLQNAKALLDRGWCQHHMALNVYRWIVTPDSSEATHFCLVGAIYNEVKSSDNLDYYVRELLQNIADFEADFPVYDRNERQAKMTAWNDIQGRTKEEVLVLLDETIARLQKE